MNPIHTKKLFLAAAAGCVDVIAVSRLGGPFASVVTGNLIQLGRSLAIPNRHLAASASTAVASYAVGVAMGTVVLRGSLPGWRRRTCVVASVELLLLLGVLAGWLITSGSPGTHRRHRCARRRAEPLEVNVIWGVGSFGPRQ